MGCAASGTDSVTAAAEACCLATGICLPCDVTNLEEDCSNSHGHRASRSMYETQTNPMAKAALNALPLGLVTIL